MDLGDLQDRQISELSGGQQQRVFLARALAQEAHALVARRAVQRARPHLEGGARRDCCATLATEGRLVMASHHDLETVRDIFDEVLLLKRRAIAFGPVAEVFTEKNLEATFGPATPAERRRMIDWLLEPLQHPFNQRALLAALLIGMTNGYASAFVVLKKSALKVGSLSHALLPGIAVAILLVGLHDWSAFLGALIAALLIGLGSLAVSRGSRLDQESALAILYTAAFSGGIILLRRIERDAANGGVAVWKHHGPARPATCGRTTGSPSARSAC